MCQDLLQLCVTKWTKPIVNNANTRYLKAELLFPYIAKQINQPTKTKVLVPADFF